MGRKTNSIGRKMNILTTAIKFATKAHGGQKRKYTGEPYINHPKNVAKIILDNVKKDVPNTILAAAVLHDVVEDTDVTIEDIGRNFGQKVMQYVAEVTDVSKPEDGNRKVRKAIDRDHLAKASKWGQTIKLADLIDNTDSIVRHDKDFAEVYMAEKRVLLEILTKGDKTLYKIASKIVKDYYKEK